MRLEPNIDYYVIDLLSNDARIFAKGDTSLLNYIKDNFPILYEIDKEINNTSNQFEKVMYYDFYKDVLEYLNLPQYIKVYSKDKLEFFEAYTNTRLTFLGDDEKKTKIAIRDNYFSCDKFNLVSTLNFFCPVREIKEMANCTMEEFISILSTGNKIQKK